MVEELGADETVGFVEVAVDVVDVDSVSDDGVIELTVAKFVVGVGSSMSPQAAAVRATTAALAARARFLIPGVYSPVD